jgi:hypothetical protein
MRLASTTLALAIIAVVASALPAYAAAPTISGFNPTSGAPGTVVSITGTNFTDGTGLTARFNGASGAVALNVSASSATAMSATVPCGAASGPIYVQQSDGNATSAATFTVSAAGLPTVSSFSPTTGTAGTTLVTITGTNLCGATAVRFNNTNATSVGIPTPTQITATVPTGATSGKISVTTAAGTGTSVANFIVGPPIVSGISPTIGPVGTVVTISGSNFTGVSAVRFNGITATYTVTNDTTISATVPSTATTGPVTVTNAVGTATGPTFTVGIPSHDRTVTFSFANNSRVNGQVNVGDGFGPCNSQVPVVIQKQTSGGWKWVDTTATTKSGSYKTYIPSSSGTFRAKVNKLTLMDGSTCQGDTSPTRHHNARR